MDSTQTVSLPEIPCAQAYNSWNPNHEAHPWLAKDQCPGSGLEADPVDIADELNGVFEY